MVPTYVDNKAWSNPKTPKIAKYPKKAKLKLSCNVLSMRARGCMYIVNSQPSIRLSQYPISILPDPMQFQMKYCCNPFTIETDLPGWLLSVFVAYWIFSTALLSSLLNHSKGHSFTWMEITIQGFPRNIALRISSYDQKKRRHPFEAPRRSMFLRVWTIVGTPRLRRQGEILLTTDNATTNSQPAVKLHFFCSHVGGHSINTKKRKL